MHFMPPRPRQIFFSQQQLNCFGSKYNCATFAPATCIIFNNNRAFYQYLSEVIRLNVHHAHAAPHFIGIERARGLQALSKLCAISDDDVIPKQSFQRTSRTPQKKNVDCFGQEKKMILELENWKDEEWRCTSKHGEGFEYVFLLPRFRPFSPCPR